MEYEFNNDGSIFVVFNHFADREYFIENPNWREQAEDDIRDYTGVSSVYADWE